MAVFKCKMCGGTLSINNNEKVATCEFCGTKQTIPNLDSERTANLFDRANHLRRNNEFDKASALYEQLLSENKEDAEIYWSLVLCRYGIEYVEDPLTHKRIPTVNRTQYESIFKDYDYKKAIEYADDSQSEIYKKEAEEINNIQKGILEISNKEKPFDVFICYKETDSLGRRTFDSVYAQNIYKELTSEGYKVFFSRITLEDKLGSAYEPYIFAALNSAKVMIVVGTSKENLESVWVKNEWSRYLALISKGKKKTLIPAYKDMDVYDLPEEFSFLQAQDMSKIGFMQDLVYGVKKLLSSKASTNDTVSEETLLKRVFIFLEDGDFKEADDYCERVLDINPESAEAYLGKLMAEFEVKKQKDLVLHKENLKDSSNYKKAMRYGDNGLKSVLRSFIESPTEEKIIVKKQKPNRMRIITIIAALIAIGLAAFAAVEIVVPSLKYNSAINKLENGSYEDAYYAFVELSDYQDSYEKAKEAYKSMKYDEALKLADNGQDDEAYEIFNSLGDFKNSESEKKMLSDRKKSQKIYSNQTGVIFTLGTYEQDNNKNNGKEDIEWRVLRVESDRALVISNRAIENMQYNKSYGDTTWETCTLRSWLNDEFFYEAFSELEQSIIDETFIATSGNPKYDTYYGNSTIDRIFLLSIDEALNYFYSDDDRICYVSDYALSKGSYTGNNGACHWWLRDPGQSQDTTAGTASFGKIYYDGNRSNADTGSVRPAMWIKLEQ